MRRLDRYIFGEILPPTALSLALYLFLLLTNVLFSVAREAVQNQIGLAVILQMLWYEMPRMLVISLPMSVLLGILIGIGRLSADSELVAIQAAGIPFRRLTLPVLALGLAATGVCFYFLAWVAPQGAYARHQLKRELLLSSYMSPDKLGPRVFHAQIPGLLLYYDAREESTGAFRRVFIYEEDSQALMERVTVARRGELSFEPESGRVNLYLEDGATHARRLDAAPDEGYSVMRFASYQESREAPAYIRAFSSGLQRNLREMSLPQLSRQVAKARAEPNPVVRALRLNQARAEFHDRFALPAACLVFSLLGLPLGVVNRRGGKASGFALSLAIVLVYWVAYSVLRDVAEAGRMDTIVALWLPNAGFALLALALTVSRMRQASSGRGLGRILGAPAALLGRLRSRPSRRPTEPTSPPAETMAFPQLIDRYVAVNFLRVFVFVMLSVYLVYTLVEFRSLADDMVDNKVPWSLMLQYLAFLIPRMTSTTLPVACLVATLVGLGLMAKSNEDTAVKASGVSVFRLLQPLLLVTALICGLGFLLQDEILPTTNQLAEGLRDRIAGRTPRSQDPRRRWLMSDDGRMFHYQAGDPSGTGFLGLSIHDLDPETFALKGRLFAGEASYSPGGGGWLLRDSWRRDFTREEPVLETFSDSQVVDLAVSPELFRSEDQVLLWGIQREPEQMSYRDQQSYIRELERRGYDTTELRVDLARKITFPVIPLFMVLLGFPFSFRVGSRGSLFGVGLAIGLTVVYWSALAVFNALGTATLLSPALAAWAPNIFFGGIGIYLSLHLRT